VPNRKLETILLVFSVAFVLAFGPTLRAGSRRVAAETRALSAVPGSVEARNTNAFARMLGEVRIGAADFLFVKTELYLHGGIGYHAHVDDLDAPAAAHSPRDDDGHDHHHDHDHGHESPAPLATDSLDIPLDVPLTAARDEHAEAGAVSTRIRTHAEDFRGFLGNLEREIKPWRDPESPHILTGGTELLPWFRLMTVANPHFVRAYRIGAMWLGRERLYDEALAYLQEGIDRNTDNPELFQLYLSKTLTLLQRARLDEDNADLPALDAAHAGLVAGLAYRPPHGEVGVIRRGLLWTPDHEEDLLFLARFVVMLLERERRFDEALHAGRQILTHFPGDEMLKRLVERLEAGASPYRTDPQR
jgi:hypothetical protein